MREGEANFRVVLDKVIQIDTVGMTGGQTELVPTREIVWRGNECPDSAKQSQLAALGLGERKPGVVSQMLFLQERCQAHLGRLALPWSIFAVIGEIPPQTAETK